MAPVSDSAKQTAGDLGLAVLLLASLTAGCGARSTLDDTSSADINRVADCERRTPDAVPLARIAALPVS